MQGKRIAVVVSTYPPYGGGMGNVAAAQARLLAKRGYQVTVITPGGRESASAPHADGVQVNYIRPFLRFGNAAWIPRLRELTAAYDAVLLHYPFFGAAGAYAHSRPTHQRLVVYYHMDNVGWGWRALVYRFSHLVVLSRLVRHADVVAASTRDYAVSSRLGRYLGVLGKRFLELPPAPDPAFVPGPRPAELVRRYRFKDGTPVALFVGGLDDAHYFKGLPVLLRAWQTVVRSLPSARLLIVGEGNRRMHYERLARRLAIAESVGFVGSVIAAELPDYYRLSTVTVLPSIDRSEAFGLVLVEAMASARAVIASDLPGVRQVVADGVNGHLVKAGSSQRLARAFVELLGRPATAARYGEAGAKIVAERYSEARLEESLASLFATLP